VFYAFYPLMWPWPWSGCDFVLWSGEKHLVSSAVYGWMVLWWWIYIRFRSLGSWSVFRKLYTKFVMPCCLFWCFCVVWFFFLIDVWRVSATVSRWHAWFLIIMDLVGASTWFVYLSWYFSCGGWLLALVILGGGYWCWVGSWNVKCDVLCGVEFVIVVMMMRSLWVVLFFRVFCFCLSGVFVVVRLCFRSISVVASSCCVSVAFVFECFKCGWSSRWDFSLLTWFLFASPPILSNVLHICVLDSGGLVAFTSRSRVNI